MSVQPRLIAANASYYTIALTLQKVLSFVYFSYLARSLGAVLTGQYFFALSIAAVVMALLDVGLTPVLTREAAKSRDVLARILNQILSIKLLLAFAVLLGMFFIVPRAIGDLVVQDLVYVALVIAVMDSFAATFFGALRSQQNLRYESTAALVFQLTVLVLGSIAIYYRFDIRVVLGALLLASIVNLLFSWVAAWRALGLTTLLPVPDWPFTRRIIVLSLPFAVAAAFVKINAYADTLMLRYFMNDAAVGIYSVAYKITFAFQFVPLALVAAVFPAFSYYHTHDRANLPLVFGKSVEYLVLITLPIVAGITVLAGEVIPLVYTESFRASVTPLIILILSLPFLFINFPVGSLLNACDRQTRQTWHLGITMAVNVALNLILIPRFGPSGAALASTASTIVMFILGVWVSRKILGRVYSGFSGRVLTLVGIAMCLVLVAYGVNYFFSWYAAVVVSGIFYLAMLNHFGLFRLRDIKNFSVMLRR